MNEGESAGGGHQGSSPAPPAVPDRSSTLPTTTTALTSNNQTTPSIITIVTTSSITQGVSSAAAVTTTSSTPRSFQQAFTQQQKPQTKITGLTFPTTAGAQQQPQQQHMPQSPSCSTAAGAVAVDTFSKQQIPLSSTGASGPYTAARSIASNVSGGALAAPETSPPSKRQKIDSTVCGPLTSDSSVVVGSLLPATGAPLSSGSNTASTVKPLDLNALKKRILEQKYLRLRSLKEKHSENVAELFYLQSGGNMMDYPTWRKKPPTPQFISFSNAYRLDQLVNESAQQQQQQTADTIATIIGVTSSNVNQQQPQENINKTNTQSQVNIAGSSLAATSRSHSSSPVNATAATASTTSTLTTTIDASGNVLPQGAEIKIPAVGATPVAVSTKLPAAVVQLTQQGHIPGRPLGGRHGMVFGQIPAPPAVGNSSVPLVPGGTPLVPCNTGAGSTALRRNGNGASPLTMTAATAAAQTPPPLYSPAASGLLVPVTPTNGSNAVPSSAGLAKQEVYVMQRISELQREGLWTEKRLPKLQEPSRPKAHWDYLLEEMVWLAADFAQERKWKKNAAKKCAKMVQKYFQDKANAAQKAEKAHEAHLKRVAAFISKEVKMFWSNVEKLVEYKHHTKLEEKRKKALDQHLSFIVDQTEKFSQQLAEGMNKSILDATASATATAAASAAPSINSSRISSPKRESTNVSDDDFRPDSGSEDDEETIAKAEEEAADVKEEVAALEKESQMDLDDFLKDLPKGYLENRNKLMQEEENSSSVAEQDDDADDVEFEANEASEDDENTISKQEEAEAGVDHKKELDELEADNDLTVEQLLEKYKAGKINEPTATTSAASRKRSRMEVDSDDDEEVAMDTDGDSTVVDSDEENTENESNAEATSSESDTEENDQKEGLKSLLEDTDGNSKDDMIKDAAALAESIQPKGNTLSSTNVVTPVPFLLKHTLREYQHIGLDWLVTMNERKLNGILADEMGLGKTIQTIALLAHLACVKGNWGPHLIVVPSSVMLNWEMEFKKWCPGFKILTYYGTQKERKLKRVGWTKPNAFHVCITSYKLVVQDQQSFRRKKWKYLILDEAQNIKNFKSQRWQLLLNFSTERRLLLTGTPLQNDLMELWSLMHFLMPYVFSSHREFKEWFSNPMTGMIEGNMEYNESLINRLHKVIRPFLLRRLKKEVEKQMPKKYEHVVMCRLSNRQRYLYDDFMSRAKTKETLQTGNLLSVINVLMQLRKVCNHPNMFEVRPTISPFQMEGISFYTARLACDLLEYDPFKQINLHSVNLLLMQLELTLTAYVSHKSRLLVPSRRLIEEIDSLPEPPPRCPTGKYKFHIRVRDQQVQQNLSTHTAAAAAVRVGASPAMKTEGTKLVPVCQVNAASSRIGKRVNSLINPVYTLKVKADVASSNAFTALPQTPSVSMQPTPAKIAKVVHGGKPYFFLTTSTASGAESSTGASGAAGGRLTLLCKPTPTTSAASNVRPERPDVAANSMLVASLAQRVKSTADANAREKMDVEGSPAIKRSVSNDDTCSESDPIYNMATIQQQRKEKRLARLKLMASINRRRTEAVPIYGADCRASLEHCVDPSQLLDYTSWQTRGYTNCRAAMTQRDNWTLYKILKSYEKRCQELRQCFANFVIYVPPACAPRIRFYVQDLTAARIQREHLVEEVLTREISPKLTLLHPIISAMTTQFPDPRLIQYDCGKLQTLDRLLRQLKSEQHRVLIFTQMTKMLDVLEAFLNYHGHIYLRLDGSTRVEQRQVLMERFNGDKRIFCFILSTRSGGVGINLTGADTVIFYDSDWNPTMDAQAQDRCHRIGQTRDVHIYRLVSEKTIEVNILKKANQKRMLSDMAIEGGNFTTSYFKSSTIKDLFNMEQMEQDNEAHNASVVRVEKPTTSTAAVAMASGDAGSEVVDSEKQSLRAFETALAAAEDEQDVQATKTAKAEAAADLAEFDETIPIDEVAESGAAATTELSRADLEMQNLVKQLSPIERYAMRFVEETGAAWTAEQLRAAEEEIEAQKREWEANRLAALQKEEEMLKQEAEAEEMLTYSRKDANNQIWISDNTVEQMPMWCPPTPPQNDNDIYIDYSLTFLYDMDPIPETELPPVYVKKEYKRSRSEVDGNRRPPKMRKEDNYSAPRSIFERPSTALLRIRRDLKNQRYRGVFKPNVQIPGLKTQFPQKPLTEPEGMAEWCIFEDITILHVLVNLQGLPCNLMQLSPGHTPNWDLVSEIVNFNSKTYRSPKQCRWRYEAVIQPREEGKLVESPKKQKKLKTIMKSEYLKGSLRCLRTTHMYANDNNSTLTKLMRARFDCIRAAYLKKAPPPKRHFSTPSLMNPKHMEVLKEFGIANYDQPISPLNIAQNKANKMRVDKQQQRPPPPPAPSIQQQLSAHVQQHLVQQQSNSTAQQIQEIVVQQQQQQQGVSVATAVSNASALHAQQLQIQHIPSGSIQQQPTAIVLQHATSLPQQQQVTAASAQQTQQQLMRSALSGHASTTQIVKAIVAPQSGLLTAGQMQQLTQQANVANAQHLQLQQTGVGASASVSVVLTTPVQTLSSVQSAQHGGSGVQASTAQIVSISPQTIVSSGTQVGSIVQTIPSQSLPQVVSVSQLATVGTVLTTSASLQPSATVTTLNTSALRAQRIVAATSSTLQDVVLQQRASGNPSPTIVSMSNLGQSVTPAQFQAAQLRLASMSGGAQQMTKVPVSTLQQGGKIATTVGGNQPAHIQLYRQRQQLKVLQATPSQSNQTLVQTAGGQTLVNAAGLGLMQATAGGPTTVQVQGQKVAVATVSSAGNMSVTPTSGVVTSVATVQVAHNQGRTQFIKQVPGKQTIARQIGDNDMVLVKRQVIGAHQKAQVLQQGQIFTTTSTVGSGVQLQQQTQSTGGVVSSQQQQSQAQQTQSLQQVTAQQIATLVKTSGGSVQQVSASGSGGSVTVAAGGQSQGTVNMALSHLKPGGQIKVTTTMANQSQMRQLHMQQHLAGPRKISRMTQIATSAHGNVAAAVAASGQQTTVGGNGGAQKPPGSGMQTQLVHIQNTKSLPNSVTVQQIQQVMRQGQAGLAPAGLVLSKTSVGRVIPVSMAAASQPNQRQTIQVVSAASAQALAAGNLRAHVTGGQNITGTIKVATAGGGGGQSQATQQAIITAIQQQAAQQSQRQNASPVRLQTTAGGNLVAVVQQQSLQQQHNVVSSSMAAGGVTASSASSGPDVMTITQSGGAGGSGAATQQQQQPQQTLPQQVRTLMKKKIMQTRSEKE